MPRKSPPKALKLEESKRLKALREALGMTLREFSEEIYSDHSSISLWEAGKRTIPGPVLRLVEIYEERLKGGRSKKTSAPKKR